MIQARNPVFTEDTNDITEYPKYTEVEAEEAKEIATEIINEIVANVVNTYEKPAIITKAPQNEDPTCTFPSKIYTEKINIAKLKYIVDNYPKFKKTIEAEELVMRRLDRKTSKNYTYSNLKKLSKACKIPQVTYNKGRNSNDIGRWYAKDGIGLQPLISCVRHTICEGIWVDIDQINSHPTLLEFVWSTL